MPETKPIALIAGGPPGLGQALVSRLARAGHDVAFCRTPPAGHADGLASQAAAEPGGRLLIHHGEVAGETEAKALIAEVEAELGPPAALVTCASGPGPAAGTPPWTIEMDRTYQLCRAVILGFIRRRRGRIVIVSPPPDAQENAARSAVAAGMHGFALALAKESGRYGVRVNAVCPGVIAEDVAELVTFLVSGRADYLNGQIIQIDSGLPR
jgi:3-oxoacyl-[acyl-carrier protein] reductase